MYWQLIPPKLIAGLVLVIALIAGAFFLHQSAYNSGFAAAEQQGRLAMAEYVESQRAAVDKIVAENRKTEEALKTKILEDYVEKEREILAINATHQRILVGLRQRARRSDPPATCPASSPEPTVCPRAGSTGAELSREDAEFLIGEAAAADTLRASLNSCRSAYNILLEPIR